MHAAVVTAATFADQRASFAGRGSQISLAGYGEFSDTTGPPGLLGLYEGVPLTERGSTYSGYLPDRISIYRQPICAICATDDDVVRQVTITVVHEVGHHFGIDDARLTELGW